MPPPVNIKKHARHRRYNVWTTHERIFWRALWDARIPNIREALFSPYIVDFWLPEYRIGVEIDGSHHNETKIRGKDEKRQRFIEQHHRLRILRFPNAAVAAELQRCMVELAEAMRVAGKHEIAGFVYDFTGKSIVDNAGHFIARHHNEYLREHGIQRKREKKRRKRAAKGLGVACWAWRAEHAEPGPLRRPDAATMARLLGSSGSLLR